MSYKEIYELSNELYAERLELVEERIEQIIREAPESYYSKITLEIMRKAMPTRHTP